MNCKNYRFTRHSTFKMFERGISIDHVKETVENGEVVQNYPEDKPYPSKLMLKIINKRPIHVVIAFDTETDSCIIITVYEPSPTLWEGNFKTRK